MYLLLLFGWKEVVILVIPDKKQPPKPYNNWSGSIYSLTIPLIPLCFLGPKGLLGVLGGSLVKGLKLLVCQWWTTTAGHQVQQTSYVQVTYPEGNRGLDSLELWRNLPGDLLSAIVRTEDEVPAGGWHPGWRNLIDTPSQVGPGRPVWCELTACFLVSIRLQHHSEPKEACLRV